MENEDSIVGIKINGTTIPAKCIMIIKKYQDLPISEIKKKIEDNQYILCRLNSRKEGKRLYSKNSVLKLSLIHI